MFHPLLYELNTRCWLRELAQQAGRPITLATVPDTQFAQWQQWGLTHVWLMGVWTGGPQARAQALANADLRRAYAEALPDWTEADVTASPYAVADYTVSEALGGEAGLASFHDRLRAAGMKLVLDFVPNHLGLDHAWVREQPGLFVQSPTTAPGTFPQQTAAGPRWLAHGRDPYFAPWTDTVQLDYRRAETCAAMSGLLQNLARRCDGVRCDMAMLLLKDVFDRTWAAFPLVSDKASEAEFWSAAISAVKAAHPDFLFLAEAYWGTEARLQSLGFDFTYDKTLYDQLTARDAAGLQAHLLELAPEGLAAGAHFLENHDEPRAASVFSLPEHRAAALVMLSLPGLRFLHEGQLTGARRRVPVQLARRAIEPVQMEIHAMYEQLLSTVNSSAVGRGEFEVVKPMRAWPDNATAQNFVLVCRQDREPQFDLVVVNLAPHRSQCHAPLAAAAGHASWALEDRLGPERYVRKGDELRQPGLYLDLPAHGAQVFQFTPV